MKKIAFIVSFALVLSSCGAMFNTKKQKVAISTNVENTGVIVNGSNVGFAPQKVEVVGGEEYSIVLKKDGYAPIDVELDKTFKFSPNNNDTKWCIISIFTLIGPIVDLATESCWVGYKGSYFTPMHKARQ